MDELVAAKRNGHVRRSWRDGTKEEQISARQIARRHGVSRLELFDDRPRQCDAVLAKDILSKTAAVEAGGIGAAISLGRATQR